MSNRACDSGVYNTAECYYDGGDCCEASCEDGGSVYIYHLSCSQSAVNCFNLYCFYVEYECGPIYDCKDPTFLDRSFDYSNNVEHSYSDDYGSHFYSSVRGCKVENPQYIGDG